MLTLLALPPELLGQILFFLSPGDIITCSKVNSHLRALIASSIGLQYALALSAARAEDNPLCIESIASKMQALNNSEDAWKSLEIKQKRKVKITYPQSGVYDLSSGIYLLSDQGRMRLYTIDLNSLTPNTPQAHLNPNAETKSGAPVEAGRAGLAGDASKKRLKEEIIKWKKVESDKFILDLGLCVYEHDLIALVTTAPLPYQHGEFQTHEIAIDIRQLSTDTPHPRAKNPVLFVMNSRYDKPAIGIEIVGKHLVLILTFNHQDRPQDRIFIFQWMDGVLKASFEAPWRSYSGLLFLNTELVCLPNTHGNSLDIFRIPEAPTLESPKPVVRLGLPKPRVNHHPVVISCRGEPNPVHPDSFAEMRAHSAYMRQQASANTNSKFATSSSSGATTSASGDDTNITHDASKIALGQAFQRATVAASEDALCLFELHITALQFPVVPAGGLQIAHQFRHRVSFVSPRSALLEAILAHEARLQEEDRVKAEKERQAEVARAEKEKERQQREREAEDRKRKRAMEAGPSRARANSPSVEEFVRQRKRDADGGDDSGQAGSLFGRTDWPPADMRVDDDHDERPYVPFGEREEGGAASGQGGGERAGSVAVSRVSAARTDVAGPSGETRTVVNTGNIQPDSVQDEEAPGPTEPVTGQNTAPAPSHFFFVHGHHPASTNNAGGNTANPDGGEEDTNMPELMDLSDSDVDDDEDEDDSNSDAAAPMGFGAHRAPRHGLPIDRTLVPWQEWNEGRTRWFNGDDHISHWITTSAGERLVRMADPTHGGTEEAPSESEEEYDSDGGATHGSVADAPGAWHGESDSDFESQPHMRVGAPFSVLDFNPRRVAAMRKWVEQQKKPVLRGVRRPSRVVQPPRENDKEEGEGTQGRDQTFVAGGLRRSERVVRTTAEGNDKGKGKAKQTGDESISERKRRKMKDRDQHVVGVWRVHKRSRKGKGREKPVRPPVPEFITVAEEEVMATESDPEPVLSTGYAEVMDDEFLGQMPLGVHNDLTDAEAIELINFLMDSPPVVRANTEGPSTSALDAPETNADTSAAARAVDEYLAQFDDDADDEDQEDDVDEGMDVEGDFMDFIEQNGDDEDENDEAVPYFFESEDSEDHAIHEMLFERAKLPRIKNPFMSTGGHLPASLVLARPPPDSLWVVPGGDLFEWEQVFAEPIINGLPYVMCTSQRRYLYDGIMLDEDRVIGTKAHQITGRIEFIDIHYFA